MGGKRCIIFYLKTVHSQYIPKNNYVRDFSFTLVWEPERKSQSSETQQWGGEMQDSSRNGFS